MAIRLRVRRFTGIAGLAIAVPFATAATQPLVSDTGMRDALVLRVASGRNPAIVVGIYENGRTRITAMGASGSPDHPLDGNTVFEIGPITKVFTSTLLADMVARGHVAYDDSVARYLPSSVRVPSRNGRAITLVDLATQFSGLPRMPDNLTPADPANPYADCAPAQMYEFLSRYQLSRDPGEQFENLGVGLLGHALARRAGTSYEALVIDRILEPLGMPDTRITLTPEMRARLAEAYDPKGFPTKNWDIPTFAGAGALRSTANDMLRFAAAALGAPGTPAPVASALAEAERPRRDVAGTGGAGSRIGLNWFTTKAGPVEIVWHNGGTGGYRTFLGLHKVHQRAVVVLATANPADDIGRHVLDPSLALFGAR